MAVASEKRTSLLLGKRKSGDIEAARAAEASGQFDGAFDGGRTEFQEQEAILQEVRVVGAEFVLEEDVRDTDALGKLEQFLEKSTLLEVDEDIGVTD